METFCTDAMRRWAALAFIFIFAATHLARAQTTSATLSGTVADSNGGVMTGVDITVTNEATGFRRQTQTNDEGVFRLPLLPPGEYSLKAQRDGFATTAIERIELPVAGQVSQDITL